MAATNIIVHLLTDRTQQSLAVILQFAQEVLSQFQASPEGQRNHRAKDGILHLLGIVGSKAVDLNVGQQYPAAQGQNGRRGDSHAC